MVDYDSCPVAICKRSDSPGSISLIIGRRLPHSLFSFSIFLVDVWKIGLKDAWGHDRMDAINFEETCNGVLGGFKEREIDVYDIDISEAKELLARGIKIAEAVGTPSVATSLLETAGSLDGFKAEGSLYKCYKCGKGELSKKVCSRILKIAKEDLESGVAGKFLEEQMIYFVCDSCNNSADVKKRRDE